ncbi:MAG: hypothetical protein V1753_03515 [Pseudomonadota bacterium]
MLKKLNLSFRFFLYAGFGAILVFVLLFGIYALVQTGKAAQKDVQPSEWRPDALASASALATITKSKDIALRNAVAQYSRLLELEAKNTSEELKPMFRKAREDTLNDMEEALSEMNKSAETHRQAIENAKLGISNLENASLEFESSWKKLKESLAASNTLDPGIQKELQEKVNNASLASMQLVEEAMQQAVSAFTPKGSETANERRQILAGLVILLVACLGIAYLSTKIVISQVLLASRGLADASRTVQATVQRQVQAFKRAIDGMERIKSAFLEIENNTKEEVSTAQQIMDVTRKLAKS